MNRIAFCFARMRVLQSLLLVHRCVRGNGRIFHRSVPGTCAVCVLPRCLHMDSQAKLAPTTEAFARKHYLALASTLISGLGRLNVLFFRTSRAAKQEFERRCNSIVAPSGAEAADGSSSPSSSSSSSSSSSHRHGSSLNSTQRGQLENECRRFQVGTRVALYFVAVARHNNQMSHAVCRRSFVVNAHGITCVWTGRRTASTAGVPIAGRRLHPHDDRRPHNRRPPGYLADHEGPHVRTFVLQSSSEVLCRHCPPINEILSDTRMAW